MQAQSSITGIGNYGSPTACACTRVVLVVVDACMFMLAVAILALVSLATSQLPPLSGQSFGFEFFALSHPLWALVHRIAKDGSYMLRLEGI